MITVRQSHEIHIAQGEIDNGTFTGRWHFSFGNYHDRNNIQFGNLRVFNDDTLSPGAVWPLHQHYEIEVVTYCADGEFRHADEHGKGGILYKGWVQHTTVGKGMMHAEINPHDDIPMRFIQMWFKPSQRGLKPSVEQKQVDQPDRTNKLLPLVSSKNPDALKMFSEADVYSCFLQHGKHINHTPLTDRGVYLYVIDGGPVLLDKYRLNRFEAAKIINEKQFVLSASDDTELLLIETAL